jgi:lipoprotein-releasing system permease protein
MFKPVSLFLALRYVKAKRRNHMISFISLVSILGLVLGVAVLIVVLSVMNGFARELEVRILGLVPHGVIYGREPISNWRDLATQLSGMDDVQGVAPIIELQGMLTHQGLVSGVMVNGIDPVLEAQVSILPKFMQVGQLADLSAGEFGIVIGAQLALQFDVGVGDSLMLVLPEASVSPAGVLPRFKRFRVQGIFEVGAELDGLMVYVHWQDAARLARHVGAVAGLRIQFADLFDAPRRIRELMETLAERNHQALYASDWTRTQGSLFQAIKMEKTMIALLLTLIMAVAAFNIVSSLVMLVNDKKGDIAVLRTLGASPQWIGRVFLFQGMIIGTVGTFFGVVLGVVLALNISDIMAWFETTFGTHLFSAYFINYLPSELQLNDVVVITLAALSLSFLATLYPSRKAALTPPAEALRYD